MTVADDLAAAKALLGTPEVGKDAHRALVDAAKNRADPDRFLDAHGALRSALPRGYINVAAWCGLTRVSVEDVVALFDRAIAASAGMAAYVERTETHANVH